MMTRAPASSAGRVWCCLAASLVRSLVGVCSSTPWLVSSLHGNLPFLDPCFFICPFAGWMDFACSLFCLSPTSFPSFTILPLLPFICPALSSSRDYLLFWGYNQNRNPYNKLFVQQSVHLTLGILYESQSVSYALAFFWLAGFAVPAPAQVTQTVSVPLRVKPLGLF